MVRAIVVAMFVSFIVTACSGSDSTPTSVPTPTPIFRTLELVASITPSSIAAGETVRVVTDAGNAGLAQYTLLVNGTGISRVQHDGTILFDESNDQATVTEWSAAPASAEWTLRVSEPGNYIVGVFVTGEIALSEGGPFIFTHGSAEFPLVISQ